jgi:phosphomannomutase
VSKTIVLFDMDGTLTKPRERFDPKLLSNSLMKLCDLAEVGIITGSDEDYLREQMGDFLYNNPCRYKLHLLPCNGTKYLSPPNTADDDFKLISEVSMKDQLGSKIYRDLICELVYSQVDACHLGLPMTGHFINCRGSTINWCPIGRNANSQEREKFVDMDREKKVRIRILEELRGVLELKKVNNKITIKFGGDTSFDIYPTGWDKTYGLNHFRNYDVWFVGDRCDKNGNDREIYEACQGKSYITDGPINTVEIIDCILDRLGGSNE